MLGADGAGSAVRGQLLAYGVLTESVDFLDYGYKELTIPPLRRRVRAGPGRAAHLAARHLDDDRAAQPGPLLHLHAVLALRRHRQLRRAEQPGGDRAALRRALSRRCRRWRRTWWTTTSTIRSGVLGTVRCAPWQVRRPGRPARRRRARHRAVLRPGRELRVRGRGRAGPLPGRVRRRVGRGAAAVPAPPAGRTPRRSPGWRWPTSWRCGTRSPRRCSGPGKRVEHALERALPGRYVSQYELVSFSTTPYAEVRRRVRRQHQAARRGRRRCGGAAGRWRAALAEGGADDALGSAS